MKQWMLTMALLIWLVTPAMAETGTAGGALPVMRFGVGARSFGLGGAYGSVVADDSATYWNPAGLAKLDAAMVSAMHSELYEGTTYDYLGWGTPAPSGGFGINLLRLATPGLVLTDGSVEDATAMALLAGYGFAWSGWNLGATLKYSRQELPGVAGQAWGIDVGLQKQLNSYYCLGLVLQDVTGSEVHWDNGWNEAVPLNWRLGLNYTRERLMLVAETEQAGDFRQNHFGVELVLTEFLKLRGGLRGSDFAAGVGLTKGPATFDYAYCGSELGNTHRLSFSYVLKD